MADPRPGELCGPRAPWASRVAIGKRRSTWCVFIDGEVVSDHRTRDGAATAANKLIRAGAPNWPESATR